MMTKQVSNLTQEEWLEKYRQNNNKVILDVRTEGECAEGVIEGAINMNILEGQGFIYKLEELDKNKSYFVYCRSGARSAQACGIMSEMGFNDTNNLIGGIMQWKGDVVNLQS